MNESNLPLVSVYIPTRNRAHLLKRAIDSVLLQTYPNIEIVVVNDGSNDGTQALLDDYVSQGLSIKVEHLDESNGVQNARNLAVAKASGEFVTGLDDDDYFLPARIQSLINAYDDKYAFVCSGYYWDYGKVKSKVNDDEKKISLTDQLHSNQVSNQVLIKKSRLLECGGYDVDFVSCQDWEVWTRIIAAYGSALRIKNVDYVIDASHGIHRITDNPSRANGFQQFKSKFTQYMTPSHFRSLEFHTCVASGKPLTLSQMLKVMTVPLFKRNLKYWLSCKFPSMARRRLDSFK